MLPSCIEVSEQPLVCPASGLLQAPAVALGLLTVIPHRGLHPWMGVIALLAQKQGNRGQQVTSVVLQSPWQPSGKWSYATTKTELWRRSLKLFPWQLSASLAHIPELHLSHFSL